MAEVLVEFDTTVFGADGTRWSPRACGAIAPDGLWEGWIEFTPNDESREPVRTPRETEQPNRYDLMYWSQGLSQAYLEQALIRALTPRRSRATRPAARPRFDAPAPRQAAADVPTRPRPLLNPFEVYRQGEDILASGLSALDVSRVRDIAIAYGVLTAAAASEKTREELSAAIVSAARNLFRRPAHGHDTAE